MWKRERDRPINACLAELLRVQLTNYQVGKKYIPMYRTHPSSNLRAAEILQKSMYKPALMVGKLR